MYAHPYTNTHTHFRTHRRGTTQAHKYDKHAKVHAAAGEGRRGTGINSTAAPASYARTRWYAGTHVRQARRGGREGAKSREFTRTNRQTFHVVVCQQEVDHTRAASFANFCPFLGPNLTDKWTAP
eukprot:2498038-Pleurochrysis_carterae.AAC.1